MSLTDVGGGAEQLRGPGAFTPTPARFRRHIHIDSFYSGVTTNSGAPRHNNCFTGADTP